MAKLPHLKTAVLIILAGLTVLFLLAAYQLATADDHAIYLPTIQHNVITTRETGGPDPWPRATITPTPIVAGGTGS